MPKQRTIPTMVQSSCRIRRIRFRLWEHLCFQNSAWIVGNVASSTGMSMPETAGTRINFLCLGRTRQVLPGKLTMHLHSDAIRVKRLCRTMISGCVFYAHMLIFEAYVMLRYPFIPDLISPTAARSRRLICGRMAISARPANRDSRRLFHTSVPFKGRPAQCHRLVCRAAHRFPAQCTRACRSWRHDTTVSAELPGCSAVTNSSWSGGAACTPRKRRKYGHSGPRTLGVVEL